MTETIYRCTHPGCFAETNKPGQRHRHVTERGLESFVEMRKYIARPGSRCDNLAKGAAFQSKNLE